MYYYILDKVIMSGLKCKYISNDNPNKKTQNTSVNGKLKFYSITIYYVLKKDL